MDRAKEHYDAVTEVWRRWVMGEDLHFGLFASPEDTLAEATRSLTAHLIAKAELAPELRVLDVGCGIGTQAVHLAEAHGCRVTGISTSPVGIELARAAARGLGDRVELLVADATDNHLPDACFDRIWSLESAHLMDQDALFRECFRVLRPGGKLALCDVCLVGVLTGGQAEIEGYRMLGHSREVAGRMRDAVHEVMHRAFGSSDMTHFRAYVEAAEAAGFVDVAVEDLSRATRPTLERWGLNASRHHAEIEAELGRAYLDDLFLALLHMSFGWGRLGGYVSLVAAKPQ